MCTYHRLKADFNGDLHSAVELMTVELVYV